MTENPVLRLGYFWSILIMFAHFFLTKGGQQLLAYIRKHGKRCQVGNKILQIRGIGSIIFQTHGYGNRIAKKYEAALQEKAKPENFDIDDMIKKEVAKQVKTALAKNIRNKES